MKLSEAILLGSTTVKPMPYGVLVNHDGHPEGCAFGMALYAIGIKDEAELRNFGGDKLMPEEWRWCTTKAPNPKLCECPIHSDIRLKHGDYRAYIAHFFNEHVMGDTTISLEQLVDYVKTIEPSETVDADEIEEDLGGYPDPADNPYAGVRL